MNSYIHELSNLLFHELCAGPGSRQFTGPTGGHLTICSNTRRLRRLSDHHCPFELVLKDGSESEKQQKPVVSLIHAQTFVYEMAISIAKGWNTILNKSFW
jgi:hypothetical protein